MYLIREMTTLSTTAIGKELGDRDHTTVMHGCDKINEVLGYVSELTGTKMPKTLPLWTAYVGLPFLFLSSKLMGKRPLYTRASLASLKADTNFPLDKVKKEFGYEPRPLRETVIDHVKFLAEIGLVKI